MSLPLDHKGMAIRMVGTVQDITELKRASEEIYLLQTTSVAVSASGNLHDALVGYAKDISLTGWVYGRGVEADSSDGTLLERDHVYYSSIEGFEKFSAPYRRNDLPPGIGLPGRAWSKKQPVWIQDVTADPLSARPDCQRSRIEGRHCIPITTDNEVIGVIVFYDLKNKEKDERIIKLVLTGIIPDRFDRQAQAGRGNHCARTRRNCVPFLTMPYQRSFTSRDVYEGRYLFINRQFDEKLFCLTRDAVKGETDLDLWPKELACEAVISGKRPRRVIESKMRLPETFL